MTAAGLSVALLSGQMDGDPAHDASSPAAYDTDISVAFDSGSPVAFDADNPVAFDAGAPVAYDTGDTLHSAAPGTERLSETGTGDFDLNSDGSASGEASAQSDIGTSLVQRLVYSLDELNAAAIQSLRTALRLPDINYEPSVTEFNLMHLFPEDEEVRAEEGQAVREASKQSADSELDDESDPALKTIGQEEALERLRSFLSSRFFKRNVSYGETLYNQLADRDADWISQIYQWILSSPEQAASRLGLPTEQVMGSWDPEEEEQDPTNPDTWRVSSWKQIHFNVVDGDGRPIALTSNAQAIASMASVYTFYQDWTDRDAFASYAGQLWNASHHCTVSIGDVYYCEGCLTHDSIQEALDAWKEAEAAKAAEGLADAAIPGEDGAEDTGSVSSASSGSGRSGEKKQSRGSDIGPGTSDAGNHAEAAENHSEKEEPVASPSEATPSVLSTEDTDALSRAEEYEKAVLALSELSGDTKPYENGVLCPGHVDLNLTVQIYGLTETQNLFSLDSVWDGWSDTNIASARKLAAQDWNLRYGLDVLDVVLGTPLSREEYTQYMRLLPSDISPERRSVISCALKSVGKIPYYYGGKARAAGYDANRFASVTSPDRKGRILSGLDCSGWVNWVYWTALGQAPSAYGTGGLVHTGQAISREELRPGDLIIRLGADSHVMLFLAWNTDGSMLCVHETGGSANNVTVSSVSSSWPYYRSLLP